MDVRTDSSQNGVCRAWRPAAICTVGLVLAAIAAEQPALPPPPPVTTSPRTGPRIQFAEVAHDFGKVVAGEVLRHTYIFTNAGDGLLEVKEVRPSCGCTTSGAWSKQVDPGQSGTIPVEFYTASFNGPIAKTLTVVCNDTNQPTTLLQVKATVWRAIEVTPTSAALRVVSDSISNTVTVLRIVNKEDAPLTLSAPESDHRAIAAELRTVDPGKAFELVVKPVPPLGGGNVFGKITLKTSSSIVPVLSIPAWIVAQPAVSVIPSQITLPRGKTSASFTRDVSIRNLGTSVLTLSQPVLNAEGIEGQLLELQPGRFFTVRLTFPAGFELPADRSVEVSLQSNHPQFPLIRVPIVPARPPAPAPRTAAPRQ